MSPVWTIEQLRTMQKMGFEYIIFMIPADVETLRIFASEIAPHLEGQQIAAE